MTLSIATLASADSSQPNREASPYLERGMRFYATQRYAEAVTELSAGYQIDPHPDFLYAIGQSHRMSGNCKAAIDSYRAYLRTNPPEVETNRAKEQIQRCETQAAPPLPVRRDEFGVPGYVMASGGVLAVGLGALALIAGNQHANEADRAYTLEERDQHATTARNYRVAGGVAIAGGVALGTLAVLRYLRSRDAVETRQPTVSATFDAQQIYVGAEIPF